MLTSCSTRLFTLAASMLLAAACGSDDDATPTEDTGVEGDTEIIDDTDVADDDTDVIDDDTDVTDDEDPGDTTAPTVALTVTENPAMVLSAFVEVTTDEDALIVVDAIETGSDELIWRGQVDELGQVAELFALNFRAETELTFTATATDEAGNVGTDEVAFTVGTLPDDFPPLEVTISEPEAMTEGYTLFDIRRWDPGLNDEWGYIIVIDATGEPRWYYQGSHAATDINLLDDGTILYQSDNHIITHINWQGETLAELTPAELGVDTFHHEINFLPNGNLITLGAELREIEIDVEGTPTMMSVVADTLLEFTLEGELVASQTLFDLLDVHTDQTPLFNVPFWDLFYTDIEGGTKDWTHGNAIIYDESDDSYIVSLRHLHAIIKFDRATGDLVWRLGPGDNGTFALGGDDDLFNYAQHAPMLTGDDRIMFYDNGLMRPLAEGEAPFSRAVEFELDTENGVATEIWEYRADDMAPFVGDADLLGDTVLINDGGLVADPAESIFEPTNQKFVRIREVTYTDTPEVVFELMIRDDAETDPLGFTTYRAERIPSLSPTVAE